MKNINANEQIVLDVFNESRSGSASLLSVIRSLEQQDKIEKASLKEVSQQLGELLHSSSELRNEVENFKRQTSLCFRELKEEMEKSKRDMLRASALNHTEVLSSIEDKLNSFHYQLNLKDNRKGGEDSNFEETKVQEDSFISFISQSSSKPKEEVSHNTNKQGRSSLISFSPDLEQNQKSGSNNKTSSDDFLQCCSMSFVQLPQSNRAEVDLDFSKTKALNGSEEALLTPRSERLGEPLESALVHEKIAGDRKQENAHCSKPESGCSGRVSTIQRSTGKAFFMIIEIYLSILRPRLFYLFYCNPCDWLLACLLALLLVFFHFIRHSCLRKVQWGVFDPFFSPLRQARVLQSGARLFPRKQL